MYVLFVSIIWLIFFFYPFHNRKTILDPAAEDPNYNPLPEEERPGGFEWGDGQAPQEDQPVEEEQEEGDNQER